MVRPITGLLTLKLSGKYLKNNDTKRNDDRTRSRSAPARSEYKGKNRLSKEEVEEKKKNDEAKRAKEVDDTSAALKAAREELLQETSDDTPPKDNTAI